MKLSELIRWLEKIRAEEGDINVCVHNEARDMPCESFIFQMKKDPPYLPVCENEILIGDYLYIE